MRRLGVLLTAMILAIGASGCQADSDGELKSMNRRIDELKKQLHEVEDTAESACRAVNDLAVLTVNDLDVRC
jgi:hypothetical protein